MWSELVSVPAPRSIGKFLNRAFEDLLPFCRGSCSGRSSVSGQGGGVVCSLVRRLRFFTTLLSEWTVCRCWVF